MREVTILVMVLCGMGVSKITYASGLMGYITAGGGSMGAQFVQGVLAIIGIGALGIIGSALLSAFGGNKFTKLVQNGSYLAACGVFLSMVMTLFDQFSKLIG